jgi:undecaprenyl-phosphate 4-deoxy-4-formamido-L-arabinose transferase
VVPVYRSEESLPLLVERLAAVLPEIADEYEAILVNDCSPDGSWRVITELAERHAWVRGLALMRNFGQHNALLCGIRAARHEVVVTMDDDLQHPPEEIVHLLRRLEAGADVVYGIPQELSHSAWRNAASRYTKAAMSRAMGLQNVRQVNAFRAFRTRLRSAFESYHSPTLLLDVLLSWGTTRFEAVAVRHEPRRIGRSNYTFGKLFNQAMLMLTGFSTGPLRLASYVGLAFAVFGFAVLTYVVGVYFLRGSVPGFTFVASIVSIFSGAQLFALGIIGEYIARIFARSMERPTYVVGDRVGD